MRWLGKTLYVSPNISLREGVGLTGCLVPGVIITEGGERKEKRSAEEVGAKQGKRDRG